MSLCAPRCAQSASSTLHQQYWKAGPGRAGFAEGLTASKALSLADRNSVAFAFKVGTNKLYKQVESRDDAKVSACDPNDLEPVREMLLLEASKHQSQRKRFLQQGRHVSPPASPDLGGGVRWGAPPPTTSGAEGRLAASLPQFPRRARGERGSLQDTRSPKEKQTLTR